MAKTPVKSLLKSSVLSQLQFIDEPTSSYRHGDPTLLRREKLVKSLKNQIKLLGGEKVDKTRAWYKEGANGIAACIRIRNMVVPLSEGKGWFVVESKEKLADIYNELITETKDGIFDDKLAEMLSRVKKKGKATEE
jgi:hypothetical protein